MPNGRQMTPEELIVKARRVSAECEAKHEGNRISHYLLVSALALEQHPEDKAAYREVTINLNTARDLAGVQ